MGKYFILQLKRVARFLPYGLCVALVLFGCLGIVYQAMVTARETEDAQQVAKIRVGMVGTAGDQYLQWGLAAMQFDSTAMSIEMVQMEEEEAISAMEQGQIAAFLVFPENFVDEALYGNVQQLRFVSTAGATGLVSIIKEEVTMVIDLILVACQSGSYGVGDALTDNGHGDLWGKHVNDLALEYVDFLFDRSKMYQVQSLEQERFVPFDRYMLGGLTVVLLMLSCLPFAPLYIRSDQSLPRLLRSQRVSAMGQVFSEFGGYVLGVLLLLIGISMVMGTASLLPEGISGWSVLVGALPAMLMVAALTYLLFSLSDHLIGGVLLTFFTVLALCFVGGCMYPITVFPMTVQRIAAVLPSGLARQSITACVQGKNPTDVGVLLGYSGAFLALAVLVRGRKLGKVRG